MYEVPQNTINLYRSLNDFIEVNGYDIITQGLIDPTANDDVKKASKELMDIIMPYWDLSSCSSDMLSVAHLSGLCIYADLNQAETKYHKAFPFIAVAYLTTEIDVGEYIRGFALEALADLYRLENAPTATA